MCHTHLSFSQTFFVVSSLLLFSFLRDLVIGAGLQFCIYRVVSKFVSAVDPRVVGTDDDCRKLNCKNKKTFYRSRDVILLGNPKNLCKFLLTAFTDTEVKLATFHFIRIS